MKILRFSIMWVGMGIVVSTLIARSALAQDDAAWRASLAEDLRSLNESVRRMTDRLDVLENNYAELQKKLLKLQNDVNALSNTAPPVANKDIERINEALKEIDAARERDKALLIEQVAKMLDEFRKRELAPPPKPDPEPQLKHTVQKGENLTTIAKLHGVSVTELKKANNLTNDLIREGQVLVIPKKD